MELITSHWHQIVFIIGLIVVAVKLSSQVKEIQKDLDNIEKIDTYSGDCEAPRRGRSNFKSGW